MVSCEIRPKFLLTPLRLLQDTFQVSSKCWRPHLDSVEFSPLLLFTIYSTKQLFESNGF